MPAVLEFPLRDNIVLVQHVIADETAVFPFARNRADPFQRHVIGIEFARIFNVIPNAVYGGPQLVADPLVVVNGIDFPAPLDPTNTRSRCRRCG